MVYVLRPVSYTHLDVYKRQNMIQAIKYIVQTLVNAFGDGHQ